MGGVELTGSYTIWHIQHCMAKGLKNLKNVRTFMISGFRRETDESCALLGNYAASSGNSLPTFRDNLSVPSSRVKNKKKKIWPICCPETSVRNCHYSLRNNPEKRSYHQNFHFSMYNNAIVWSSDPGHGSYNFPAQNSQHRVCRNKWRFPLGMMKITYRFGGERSAHVQDSYVLCVARRHLACVWCLRGCIDPVVRCNWRYLASSSTTLSFYGARSRSTWVPVIATELTHCHKNVNFKSLSAYAIHFFRQNKRARFEVLTAVHPQT